MKIRKSLVACTALALVLFQSCIKDSDRSPKNALLNGNWRIESASISSSGTPTTSAIGVSIDSCDADDIFNFEDNNVLITDAGVLKCNASDPQQNTTTWSVSADGDILTIDQMPLNVLSHTDNTVVASYGPVTTSGSIIFVLTNN